MSGKAYSSYSLNPAGNFSLTKAFLDSVTGTWKKFSFQIKMYEMENVMKLEMLPPPPIPPTPHPPVCEVLH